MRQYSLSIKNLACGADFTPAAGVGYTSNMRIGDF
jgi:hypothetical protein